MNINTSYECRITIIINVLIRNLTNTILARFNARSRTYGHAV